MDNPQLFELFIKFAHDNRDILSTLLDKEEKSSKSKDNKETEVSKLSKETEKCENSSKPSTWYRKGIVDKSGNWRSNVNTSLPFSEKNFKLSKKQQNKVLRKQPFWKLKGKEDECTTWYSPKVDNKNNNKNTLMLPL